MCNVLKSINTKDTKEVDSNHLIVASIKKKGSHYLRTSVKYVKNKNEENVVRLIIFCLLKGINK